MLENVPEKRRKTAAAIDKTSKLDLPPSEALCPVPVVLVSCTDKEKRSNIITIAWCGIVCSKPPLISISIRPSRHSHNIIKSSMNFVVNIPPEDLVKKADECGMISGREIDKFKTFSFTTIESSVVSAPLIKECPINIECKLISATTLGSHDLFIGEVVAVHADKSILDSANRIDYGKARPFVYNQGEYWNLGKRIGRYGFSRE